MSDAQNHTIEDDVEVLVRLCGHSPEHAAAELTAYSHRERAGLIPVGLALRRLASTTPTDATPELNRQRWHEILRGHHIRGGSVAA